MDKFSNLKKVQERYSFDRSIQNLFEIIKDQEFSTEMIGTKKSSGRQCSYTVLFRINSSDIKFQINPDTTYEAISQFLLRYDPLKVIIDHGAEGAEKLGLDGITIDALYVYVRPSHRKAG